MGGFSVYYRKCNPVCDKPYHTNNGFQQMQAEIKKKVEPCIDQRQHAPGEKTVIQFVFSFVRDGDMQHGLSLQDSDGFV